MPLKVVLMKWKLYKIPQWLVLGPQKLISTQNIVKTNRKRKQYEVCREGNIHSLPLVLPIHNRYYCGNYELSLTNVVQWLMQLSGAIHYSVTIFNHNSSRSEMSALALALILMPLVKIINGPYINNVVVYC